MFKFIKNHEVVFAVTLSIIISAIITLLICNHYNNFYSEDNIMVVKVLDKKEDTYATYNVAIKMAQSHHDYYIIWDEGELEVSKSIYDDIDIGDKIIIRKTIIYDKRTNDIHKIYYEYGGE